MIMYVVSFLLGALLVCIISRLLLHYRMDKAYQLGLKHAKEMYLRFPNDFIEAIDTLMEKNEVRKC